MENFNLTDEEKRTFAEWFSNLDLDKQAKLSFKTVTHFFSAFQLSDNDLDKIFDICGAKRLDHFCRSQFYIALKLVALAQNSYELSVENLSKPNLPLPRKLGISSFDLDKIPHPKSHLNSIDSYSSIITNSTSAFTTDNKLPPPVRIKSKIKSPSQFCSFCNKPLISSSSKIDQEQAKNLKSFVLICPNCKHSNQNSPNEQSNTTNVQNISDLTSGSSENSRCSSPELYETIETSLALNKLKEWEKIEKTTQDYVGGLDDNDESKHCLLNDEEEQVESNKICLNINNYDQYDSSYFNTSNFANTLEESDDDVWSMSDDQVKYYYEKFCQLLPSKHDTRLVGTSVKSFFEKSKLSLPDLKQIWTLSDLDADGHLSLIEFCIAMHLIVLRRNMIELPDELPISLSPLKINQLLIRNRLSEDDQSSNNSSNSSSLQPNYHLSPSNMSTINVSTHSISAQNSIQNHVTAAPTVVNLDSLYVNDHEITLNSPNNREWTKFNNSPFTTANPNGRQRLVTVDSNQHHLNNHQSIVSDVNCLMTPANFTDKIELDPTLIHPLAVKGNQLNSQQFIVDSINSQSNKDATSRIYKNPVTTVLNPPIYPPRPRGHARSSSLDLTRSMMVNVNPNAHPQGAFVNYRKHIQQQHGNSHHLKSTQINAVGSNRTKDKQYFLHQLKTKYKLPEQYTNDGQPTAYCLKERIFHFERMHDELIEELANALNALEQLSVSQQRNA